MDKVRVGVLGSTGSVGQRYVNMLRDHPWFELTALSASASSVGKKYRDASKWVLDTGMPNGPRICLWLQRSEGVQEGKGRAGILGAPVRGSQDDRAKWQMRGSPSLRTQRP